MASDSHIDLSRDDSLDTYINHPRLLLNFHATWAAPCAQMNQVFQALSKTCSSKIDVKFISIDTDGHVRLSASLNVSAVPAFLWMSYGVVLQRIEGADVAGLKEMVEQVEAVEDADLGRTFVEKVIENHKVVLFGKSACEYCKEVKTALEESQADFQWIDVEDKELVRKAAKERDGFGSFPVIYVGGSLLGGVDVIRELKDSNTLKERLQVAETKAGNDNANGVSKDDQKMSDIMKQPNMEKDLVGKSGLNKELEQRLKMLTNKEKLMLFMKGEPNAPCCKFSRATVDMLAQNGIKYGSFDILSDPEVRQGLKVYSKWPTYPQLYSNGSLVGGYDIIKELVSQGELKSELGLD